MDVWAMGLVSSTGMREQLFIEYIPCAMQKEQSLS